MTKPDNNSTATDRIDYPFGKRWILAFRVRSIAFASLTVGILVLIGEPLIGVVFAGFIFVCHVVADALIHRYRIRRRETFARGVSCEASVLLKKTSARGTYHSLVVQYTVGESGYSTKSYVSLEQWLRVHVGDDIHIRVLPEQPWRWILEDER